MNELGVSLFPLIIIFFLVAALYSSVGLGGGSSYVAILAIAGVHYELIPTTALTLNVVVTVIGAYNYWRGGHLSWKLVGTFLIASVPMSYLGGAITLDRQVFYLLLLITLIFVAARIYLLGELRLLPGLNTWQKLALSLLLGAILGFIAGTMGIGGGIYLVPLIIVLGLASEKQAAAAGAVFVLLNSTAGLAARLQRGVFDLELMLSLVGAVILGGFIGSHFGSRRFRPRTIQKMLGSVTLIAIILLTRKIWMQS